MTFNYTVTTTSLENIKAKDFYEIVRQLKKQHRERAEWLGTHLDHMIGTEHYKWNYSIVYEDGYDGVDTNGYISCAFNYSYNNKIGVYHERLPLDLLDDSDEVAIKRLKEYVAEREDQIKGTPLTLSLIARLLHGKTVKVGSELMEIYETRTDGNNRIQFRDRNSDGTWIDYTCARLL